MAAVIDLTLEQKMIVSKELGMRADELILDFMPQSSETGIEMGENMIFAVGKTYSPS